MELKEFIGHVDACLDLDSEESLLAATPYLQALGSNRRFLAQYLTENLERPDFQSGNLYSGATLILARGKHCVVRVVGWSSAAGPGTTSPRQAHVHPFGEADAIAHTHPFALLTYGYQGPGYVTEIFDCDPDELSQRRVGEPVTLGPSRRAQLSEGAVLFFPAFRIAHIQHPPEAYPYRST